MADILRKALTGPSVWHGNQFTQDLSWIHELSEIDIGDLESALSHAKNTGVTPGKFSMNDFPLQAFGTKIKNLLDEVQNGRGFAIFRGLPVERYERSDLEIIFWGIGAYMGEVISQNSKGDLIAEVTDKGASYKTGVNDRGYMSRDKLNPHVDTSDMTALLCVRKAGKGGVSSLTSSAAIYNKILSHRPDMLDTLYRGFYHDLRGEGPTGSLSEVTHNRIPVFSYYQGLLSCCYNDKIMRSAHEKINMPLTDNEKETIDYLLEIAESTELRCDFELEVGDIQFINNYVLLHSRSAFESNPDPAERRCLLRMWMNCRDPRPLARDFSDRYNTGPRGGVFVPAV